MSYPVQLYIYDLSQGMARSLGPALGLHDLEGEFDMILVRTIFLYLCNVYVRPLGTLSETVVTCEHLDTVIDFLIKLGLGINPRMHLVYSIVYYNLVEINNAYSYVNCS